METQPATTAPRPERIPSDVLFSLVREITSQLDEPNQVLIRRIVTVIGVERAKALLAEVLEIEAEGGRMTVDGTRRKTPGGLFITLARAHASPEEKAKLYDFGPKKSKAVHPVQATPAQAEAGQVLPKATPAAVPTLTWEEAKQLVNQVMQAMGEAKTVKITLVGRPGKVVQQQSCVVVAMKGKEPPTLPTGLPKPPANSAITWAVFIATKQWEKVKASIQTNADDQLIIEGYPLLDPKSQAGVVLATSCKSVMQERAQREAKQGGPA